MLCLVPFFFLGDYPFRGVRGYLSLEYRMYILLLRGTVCTERYVSVSVNWITSIRGTYLFLVASITRQASITDILYYCMLYTYVPYII